MNESPIFQDDKNDNEVEVPPVVDVNIDEDDLGVSEVNLDDDDDIFKSARLEPEPMKVEPAETFSSRPAETSGVNRRCNSDPQIQFRLSAGQCKCQLPPAFCF